MTIPCEIPENYRCPFCTNHKDYDFIWHELAETYLCLGCYDEIKYGLDFKEQPTVDEYNCADTIEKLLKHMGISYAELKEHNKQHCSSTKAKK